MKRRSLTRRTGVFVVGLALLVAACGPDETEPDPTVDDTEPEPTAEEEPAVDDAETFELSLAAANGREHATSHATAWWIERVEELTDGRVTISASWGGAMMPFPELLAGAGDGRVDIANGNTTFHPAELPVSQLTTVPFVQYDIEAQVRALHDAYQEHEALRGEYEASNVHVLAFQPMDQITIASDEPWTGIDDIDGQRIRALGRWAEALEILGAEPIAVPFGEVYEAAQRGLIDGVGLNFEGIADTRVYEQMDYLTDPNAGSVSTMLLFINLDVWNDLPQDIQDAMTQAAEEHYDEVSRIYGEVLRGECESMHDTGVEFSAWDDAEVDRWLDVVGDSILEAWSDEVADIEGAAEFTDFYFDRMAEHEPASEWQSGLSICMDVAGS